MKTTGTTAAEPATKTATDGGDKLLYRVAKVPEGRKCLRVRIGENGWRLYAGGKIRLSKAQAAAVNDALAGALEPIPEI